MSRNKEWAYGLLALLCIVVLIVSHGTITNEWKKELEVLQNKNEELQLQIEIFQHRLEIYQQIISKDKKHIQQLEQENEELRTIRARVTAYSPMDNQSGICADSDPTVTATGTKTRVGVVAVDPKKIPYGTEVFIPDYGLAVAEDTGGKIRAYDGVAIDLLMENYKDVRNWGVQYIDVKVFW